MPSESRSILSRFSSPLTKRSAKIFDFDIETEHPHKVYRPGDQVKGQVVLSVFKGLDITHLTISLHGYAQVFKHQCTPGEAKVTPEQLFNGKGSHGFEYFGNGLASLFQDERTLCGSGFLKKQVYKFGFELEFPSGSLPGTIEFERGAVNYMVSATVTRPTAIMPTTNRVYKVKFENRIDIASMYTPKSRAVYFEPSNRRGKVKKVNKAATSSTQDSTQGRSLSRQNTSTSTRTRSSSIPLQNPPLSPAPSEDTVATHTTSSTHSFRITETSNPQRKPSNHSEQQSSSTSVSAHTISATTEIQRHGALPGDFVPVRVKVEHTRAARGIVIATLYRQGRIDMLPALPLANRSKDKKPEYEDVYPKSRTGLGGLYFTKGAPNMAFRKDLTQTSTMMIVDPQSKTADVNFKVRVPNEVFPTIDNIQGGMISFTYHIEVVIDLVGKLGESRILPSLTTNGPSFSAAAVAPAGNQVTHEWADNILDTAPLRRVKNVAAFELPLTIGTDDSARDKNKAALTRGYSYTPATNDRKTAPEHNHDHHQYWSGNAHDDYDPNYGNYGYDAYSDGWLDEHGNPIYDSQYDYHNHYDHSSASHHRDPHSQHNGYQIPPPQGEQHLDEKSRLRRQEELLLPSAPPDEDGSPGRSYDVAPSAPSFDSSGVQIESRSYSSIPITISRASARSADTIVPDPLTPPPSLPEDSVATTAAAATEDKQELERQRLAAQASAPPTDDDDDDDDESPGPSTRHASHMPTAPIIDDEAEYIAQTLRQTGHESLPQYQR